MSAVQLCPWAPFLCLQVDGEREKNFHRRGAEREEDAEGEEQKGDLTQGQKSSSILITSHESQITVEQSETQHKGAKAQRSDRIKVKNRHGGA